ncbi:MAG: hypothetical protein C5B54_04640 [Acidobacteria bacterium]|nr:MAG: hypothetical protein C5B54_04640 [Acidobacteriota bacterium]
MLNHSPIFVNGFQRGGTNILVNLIASHPDVELLGGETHELFLGKPGQTWNKWLARAIYLPVVTITRQHIFSPSVLEERRDPPEFLKRYIDAHFYFSKRRPKPNPIHRENENGKRNHNEDRRLICKNVNGVVFTTSLFRTMYKDAVFLALVRNGFALCEGFLRRGWTASRFGKFYNKICSKILQDARTMDNYHVVTFEELMADPSAFVQKVYEYSRLNIGEVDHFQLQAKPSMDKDGNRKYSFGGKVDRERRWFTRDQLASCFRADVNENQIAQLTDEQKNEFLKEARYSMEALGYL